MTVSGVRCCICEMPILGAPAATSTVGSDSSDSENNDELNSVAYWCQACVDEHEREYQNFIYQQFLQHNENMDNLYFN